MYEKNRMKKFDIAFVGLGLLLVVIGHVIGLFIAPKEAMMGDVGRILYVHVPTTVLGCFVDLSYCLCCWYRIFMDRKKGWDATLEASLEVGVLLNIMLIIQGSIWAKPTWGIWWTWDPRLTTTAIICLSFIGVILLRQLITNAQKRATYSAVGAIVAFG